MANEQGKDTVRRMLDECVNVGRADLLAQHVTEDVLVHASSPGAAPDIVGLDQLRQAFTAFREVFPDLVVRADQLIAEDDLIANRWTATGTHSGPLAGVPASGCVVSWTGTDVYRLADGRIAEWWRHDDASWLLRQVSGADPATSTPARPGAGEG